MFQIGMPTLLETPTLCESAKLCRKLGLDFVELNMNLPQYQPPVLDASVLIHIAKQHGIYYTIHLDENLNFCDFNPYVAEAYIRTVKDTIALAIKIEAPIINMHLSQGVYFTLPQGKIFLFDAYRDQYLKNMLSFRNMCEREIGDRAIKICVENCDGFTGFQKEAIDLLLESAVFGFALDIGHDHSCGGNDREYILCNKNRLCHMHLHDAIGKKNHLPLGTGEINVSDWIELARMQRCRMVVETKTVEGLKRSVHWLRNAHMLL